MVVDKLDIYDVLVTTIPGIAFLLLLSVIPPFQSFINQLSIHANLISVIFLVTAYVSGSVVQWLAKNRRFHLRSRSKGNKYLNFLLNQAFPEAESINYEFERRLRRSIEESPLTMVRNSVEYRFVKGSEQFFGIDFTKRVGFSEEIIRGSLLYRLVASHLQKEEIVQFNRWRMMKTFFRGLWFTFLLMFVLYTFYLTFVAIGLAVTLPSLVAGFTTSTLSQTVLVVLIWSFLPIGIIASNRRRREYGIHQASTLIEDFYANILVQNENIKLPKKAKYYSHDQSHELPVNSDGKIRVWPFDILRLLQQAAQQDTINPIKEGGLPKDTSALYLFFTLASDLTALLLEEKIQMFYRDDEGNIPHDPVQQINKLKKDGYIDNSLKGQCLLALSFDKRVDSYELVYRGSLCLDYGKKGASLRQLETYLGLVETGVNRLHQL